MSKFEKGLMEDEEINKEAEGENSSTEKVEAESSSGMYSGREIWKALKGTFTGKPTMETHSNKEIKDAIKDTFMGESSVKVNTNKEIKDAIKSTFIEKPETEINSEEKK
ncbi:MAG: hypothetical protein UR23_C0040G0006 [Candidatus Roizmanbacteria bacterium GW2011_GWA2_32_13]|uniref:Uncharacterized protein n=1 Tax=Candidatus Roizmanbacteria bacterium GW2011_GWA2_32_13 TaxID=1618475 RepID=A0A0F9YR98_9BACT|nr:MAG: hypothetical protein UR23_C0040G0006 [Candidatus Roizmanbacteria bacterium GW2011_GWA2_32_13]